MKKKKAPGPDNITTEVLLALREKLIPAMCVLYDECLRLGIIPKKKHRETIGVHPDQYGYRSGRSTEDAINKALGIVDESENKYVVAIFIDISGAFDNLWWPAFFGRLREMQCPGALYKSFRSYCQDRYANLSCPTGKISPSA
ncbi:hypothetical protein JTB14_001961 [Gonioctena quinquepunctata]|nr:hypothetical protein JTB14_001961 [Gonioctena quinquepunctata]